MCLSKPTEYTTQRVNPNMDYGLKFIIVYPHWLIDCNQDITLMWGVKRENVKGKVGEYGNSLYSLINFLKT